MRRLATALVVLAAAAAGLAETRQLPLAVRALDTVAGEITGVDDTDRFGVFLAAGDSMKVKAKQSFPTLGLAATLAFADPDGAALTPPFSGQGTGSASFSFTAVKTGTHIVTLTGDPGGFAGSTGTYRMSFSVKRVKPPKFTFDAAAGGPILAAFSAPAGSTVTINAGTKKGGFDLASLDRPDGSPEPAFLGALKTKNRTKAGLAKFALTGGGGVYTLRGQHDAGSAVGVSLKLATGEKKRTVSLTALEPKLDPGLLPFPTQGIVGTLISVAGENLDFEDRTGEPDLVPSFFVGGVPVVAANVTHPNGTIFRFPIPEGLAADRTYDISVFNADGQGAITTDAFFLAPPPTVTGLSILTAGPAGGRPVRVFGQNLRSGTLVSFGGTSAQATGGGTSLDVIAPAHAPGDVSVSIRDEFGQTADVPGTFTYLDVPSNRITSISPSIIQGIGGTFVTVNGANLTAESVLTMDGQVIAASLVSPTTMTFVAAEHAEAMVDLRVTDPLGQTSSLSVRTAGFTNTTENAIPAPLTASGAVEGWRATRVLTGDVDGDTDQDLILLRPEKATGDDANRSRLRLLVGNGSGAFSDVTASRTPAVSGDEDWRAKDGVLADLDGDNDLDLAIITDEAIEGGTRSSLRILANNGSGVFTDVTSTAAPALAAYGDRNQGVAIAAANLDGASGRELVILHTAYFTETIITPGGPPSFPPDPPPPPDTVEYFYYPGTRILVNSGSGTFSRKANALPAITPTTVTQYQGNALAVGDVNGANGPDIVITRFAPIESPASSGQYVVTASLLANGGTAVFTDVSASKLPATGDPEYLQGDRLELVDLETDGDLDLVVSLVSPLVSPVTSQVVATSASRLFANDGSGGFTNVTGSYLPGTDATDRNQASKVLVADFSGDGKPEIVFVSYSAPVSGERAARIWVRVGSTWQPGSKGLPAPAEGDDLRAADAVAVDVDNDGVLDIVLSRDEASNTVRSTLVLVNPR